MKTPQSTPSAAVSSTVSQAAAGAVSRDEHLQPSASTSAMTGKSCSVIKRPINVSQDQYDICIPGRFASLREAAEIVAFAEVHPMSTADCTRQVQHRVRAAGGIPDIGLVALEILEEK